MEANPKRLVLVVGGARAGKSSLVRAVSGAWQVWHRSVDAPTGRTFWAWSRSLQEEGASLSLLSERLHEVLDDKDAVGVVLASRPNGTEHLSIANLVNVGRVFGWTVVAVLLDPPHDGSVGYLAAAQAEFAALDVPTTVLDGRRWPALNAPTVLGLLLSE